MLDCTAQLATSNEAFEREVGERRLAEQQIKALFRRMITTQEAERRRIARDIHDQVGQQMTALRMHLEALRARVDDDETLPAAGRAHAAAGGGARSEHRLPDLAAPPVDARSPRPRRVAARPGARLGRALRDRRRLRELGAGHAARGRRRDQPLSHRPGSAAQRRQACAGEHARCCCRDAIITRCW